MLALSVTHGRQVLSKAMLKGAHQRAIKVYSDLRGQAMQKMLSEMGLQTAAYAELQMMSLEQLEEKIKRWIEMVSALVVVLSAEKSLVRRIFSESATDSVFSRVVNEVLLRVASFGRDILKTSHKPQKLFALLDMHQALEHVCHSTLWRRRSHDVTGVGTECSGRRRLRHPMLVAAS